MPDYYMWLRKANVNFDSEILGCRAVAMVIFFLRSGNLGFRKLTGIDPFVANDILTKEVMIFKKQYLTLPRNSIL
jgi:hypothetical protein